MNLLDGIISRFGYQKTGTLQRVSGWQSSLAEGSKWSIPDGSAIDRQETLYRKLSWIQIAVSTLAQSCATESFSVVKMEGERPVDITNHPFEKLLRHPNPLDSKFELLEGLNSFYKLTGKAYWWLNRMDKDSEPVEIWNIPPQYIQPVPDGKLYLRGYKFTGPMGESLAFEPWEIVQFKRFNPQNPFDGLSPIEAIATQSAGDLKMTEWNARLYGDSNGRLPGILAFADPILDADWEQMKADTKQAAKERAIMMLRNSGNGGVQWIQTAISQKDMEYISSRGFTKEEIFNIFTPGLASMLATSATEANANAGRSTFDEFSRWPLLEAIGEKITNDILPVYGDDLVGAFDEIRKKNQEMRLRNEEAYARVHTVDEVRNTYYGDKPVGDDRGNLFPAEVIKNGAPVPGVTADPVHGTERIGAEDGQDDGAALDENPPLPPLHPEQKQSGAGEGGQKSAPLLTSPRGGEGLVADELSRWQRKAIKALKAGRSVEVEFVTEVVPADVCEAIREGLKGCESVEDIAALFACPQPLPMLRDGQDCPPPSLPPMGGGMKAGKKPPRDAFPSRGEFEALMEKRVSGEWKGQFKKLLDLLGDPPKIENVPITFWDDSNKGLRRVFEQTLEEIFMEKAHLFLEVAPIGGVDWTQVNEGATDWARSYTYDLVKDIDDKTRKGIAKEVIRYYRDGLTVDDIGRNLEKYYSPERARTIAVTETTRAAVQGDKAIVDEIEKYGIEMVPFLLTANDALAEDCAICGGRNEKEITDGQLPPLHPNCRCDVRWEIKKGGSSGPSTSSGTGKGTGGKNG